MDFTRSGGPGGQNVNKVNSKVIARVGFDAIRGLSERERAQARERLASRLTAAGELVVQASEERDQVRNRAVALERLIALVEGAAQLQKRRVPTKPGRGARERRLTAKKVHSATKRLRRPGEDD